MAEVSFHKEIESLRLGAGDTFYGEGILAVTKALLQSGVAYVGGYQGAPVSHLLDVLVQSEDLLSDLGIHLETCTNEAAAAAMLARLHQLSPARRRHLEVDRRHQRRRRRALQPRLARRAGRRAHHRRRGLRRGRQRHPGAHARLRAEVLAVADRPAARPADAGARVEKGFELSEASNTPVILELRIRACHMFGSFLAKDNVAAAHSRPRTAWCPPASTTTG